VAGAEAREVTADHMCFLASGMMVTPSRARRASIHSAAQASSDIFVDPQEGLQSHGLFRVLRERAAEIMPVAVHGERRRPD
jgi:hypothetical protein